jgi:hypothetical protein
MTFEEIELYCKGYETREARRKELPRLMATILMNVYRKEGSQPVDVKDVMVLYTDKETPKVDLISREEYEEMKEWRKQIKWQTKN